MGGTSASPRTLLFIFASEKVVEKPEPAAPQSHQAIWRRQHLWLRVSLQAIAYLKPTSQQSSRRRFEASVATQTRLHYLREPPVSEARKSGFW